MPFDRGHKHSRGRPPGAKNKRKTVEEVCLDLGLDPFRTMAEIASDRSDPNSFQAVKELAQYLEPKRKAVEHTGTLDVRIQQELESLMRLSEEELLALLPKKK